MGDRAVIEPREHATNGGRPGGEAQPGVDDAELEGTDVGAHPGHGTESFFIVGEGLISESRGGREDGAPDAGGGLSARIAAAGAPPTPRFRFSRMGPKGRALGRPLRKKLAIAMTAGGRQESAIPAGYTYLGQFVDHDLTFDRTKVILGHDISPAELLQGRSPKLDLDSLYGGGPANPKSAVFYAADHLRLKAGTTEAASDQDGNPLPPMQGFDLPRDNAHKHAIIPDLRNDENLVVAQTHLAFIRFHNRIAGTLSAVPAAQRFPQARALVTKHYQWMLRHDYLPRICDPAVVDDVFVNGRKVFEAAVAATAVPTMPVEFSVAAFRLGHSMVRGAYNWNRVFDDGAGTLDFLFSFSGTSGDLGNGARLPSNWIADFRRLYAFSQPALKVPPAKFNNARRIDTILAQPLRALPPGSFGATQAPPDPIVANLAFRNLARAKMLSLATGQQMAALLNSKGVAVTALTPSQILDGATGAKLDGLSAAQRTALAASTPLWFYVLREAELNGGRLSGVGARIVAETFHRAIEGSRFSIVRDTAFKPQFGPNPTTFDMRDLLFFAFEGKKELLAPLG